jgi:hypothetical protein
MNEAVVSTAATAATAAGQAPGKTTSSPLPERAGAIDAAAFQRLFEQAQQEQAAVQFSAASEGAVRQSVSGVTRVIDTTSNRFVAAIDDSRAAISKANPADTKSIIGVIESMTVAAVHGAQLQIMLHEVAGAKKSFGELFHNQG